MTQGLGHQKHQDAVIHRIQVWEITNYIPHAVGHQLSLLLEVCHQIWLNTLLCNDQSIYLSIMCCHEQPWDFPEP